MRDAKKQSVESFNRQARLYDTTSCGRHARGIYPVLLTQLEQIPHRSLLDVGCGTGALLKEIVRRWPETGCSGVDLSPEMVEVAQKRLGTSAVIMLGDAEKLPCSDAAFDVVLCCDSFHHYPNPAAALEEIHRVLRPGGVFLLGDTTAPALLRPAINLLLPMGRDGDVRLYSGQELVSLLSQRFHGVEYRDISSTSLLAWGIK